MYYDQYGDSYGTSNTSGKAHQFEYNYRTGEFKARDGNRKGYCLQRGGFGKSWKTVFVGCNGGDLQKFEFVNGKVRNSHTNQCLQYLTSVDYPRFAWYDCVSDGNEKFEYVVV